MSVKQTLLSQFTHLLLTPKCGSLSQAPLHAWSCPEILLPGSTPAKVGLVDGAALLPTSLPPFTTELMPGCCVSRSGKVRHREGGGAAHWGRGNELN